MANVLYIPFEEDEDDDGNIQAPAREAADYGVTVVYLRDKYTVQKGDVLVLNAHGAKSTTKVYGKQDEEREMKDVLFELSAMRASRAERVIFFMCFSSQPGHIAEVYKRKHQGTEVWGTDGLAQGAIAKFTRSGMHSSLFTDTYHRLTELP
jgi:hypothetical protein